MISRRLRVDGRTAYIGILCEEGLRALRRNGHDALAGCCAPDLPADRVRFVDASVRAALEAASEAELAALFGAPFPARPFVTAAHASSGLAATVNLRFQPDLACLRGHFPELPVVPGAAQLGWVLEFGAELLGTRSTMSGARTVKFERIIQPGRAIRLQIEAVPDGGALRFVYSSASGKHSAGHIAMGAGDD